ncbi:MAG: TonB family protein [Rikenellaceae bacterium]|jgi:TonB family protein|nr:TonB family protein [Rikenellaceae bacterium]
MDDIAKKAPSEVAFPFQRRHGDAGEWAFDHRAALLLTVVIVLSLSILFVGTRIMIGQRKAAAIVLFEPATTPPQQPAPQEQAAVARQGGSDDYSDVRNRVSNAAAAENRNLRDSKGIDANELYREAQEVAERVRANRDAYERGLAENAGRAYGSGQGSGGPNEEGYSGASGSAAGSGGPAGSSSAEGDVKLKGRVTGSFSLTDPLRTSVRFHIPAYRCQGGGEVVVNIEVDRNGRVVAASVDRSVSSSDGCMTEMALDAARRSRFNTDNSAPDPQRGTIDYIFIPQ